MTRRLTDAAGVQWTAVQSSIGGGGFRQLGGGVSIDTAQIRFESSDGRVIHVATAIGAIATLSDDELCALLAAKLAEAEDDRRDAAGEP